MVVKEGFAKLPIQPYILHIVRNMWLYLDKNKNSNIAVAVIFAQLEGFY